MYFPTHFYSLKTRRWVIVNGLLTISYGLRYYYATTGLETRDILWRHHAEFCAKKAKKFSWRFAKNFSGHNRLKAKWRKCQIIPFALILGREPASDLFRSLVRFEQEFKLKPNSSESGCYFLAFLLASYLLSLVVLLKNKSQNFSVKWSNFIIKEINIAAFLDVLAVRNGNELEITLHCKFTHVDRYLNFWMNYFVINKRIVQCAYDQYLFSIIINDRAQQKMVVENRLKKDVFVTNWYP